MGTVLENIKDNENGYSKRVHLKGASEIVLGNCTKWMNQDGQVVDLDDGMKQHLLKIIESYAERALRTICLAYKDLKQNEGGVSHDEMAPDGVQHEVEQTGFTCFAILGIKDVIRKEVPDAVKKCKSASIKVRMVTGDNKITAKAISKECNIYEEDIALDE
jgi:magnesium-transporting ATPase (P-type)